MLGQRRSGVSTTSAMQGARTCRAPLSMHRGRGWAELLSFGIIGLSIGAALIIGMQYFGMDADAHVAASEDFAAIAAPIPALQTKEDPLVPLASLQQAALADSPGEEIITQTVARADKADMLITAVFTPQDEELRPQPRKRPGRLITRIPPSPPVWKIEQGWRLARLERARVLAARKKRLRELSCLAKAVYFEARSESLKGQMAVAKVILNRVRDPRFPNTICGVVYQGSERRHACQFSFACDGKSDYPTNSRQWRVARRIAIKAMRGQIRLRGLEGVAFYHADYVRPTWASMMRPVIKIGRHIFYRDS